MNVLTVSKCIVVNSDGNILLLRRSADDKRRPNQWDIPGGHVENSEHAADAAARETSEEAGIEVDPKELTLLYAMTEVPDEDLSVTWVFYMGVASDSNVTLGNEHSEYQWVALHEAVEMITYHRQNRALQYVLDNDLLSATPV